MYLPCIFPIYCLRANWGQIGFRREADRILRRIRSAAWIIDRPFALLSHAVENPRPLEPAFTRSARERWYRVGEPELTLIQIVRTDMTNSSKLKSKFSLASMSARAS